MATIEFAVVERAVVEGLKRGNVVLRDLQQEMSIESVEKLMEETREAVEYQQEISALLSDRLDVGETSAVEEEYEQMVSELRVASLPTPPSETKHIDSVVTRIDQAVKEPLEPVPAE